MSIQTISLSKGKEVLIDSSDYEFLSQWKWCYAGGYAIRQEAVSDGRVRQRHVKMHRVINSTPDGMFTDHINGNTLDNRRVNLRTVTPQQNSLNRKGSRKSKSGYKGVYWNKHRNKWTVFVWTVKDGKRQRIYGGIYKDKHEAAKKYNKLVSQLYGEYAFMNTIRPEDY